MRPLVRKRPPRGLDAAMLAAMPAVKKKKTAPAEAVPWHRQDPVQAGTEALRRMSQLPAELQDMILRYLPLADIVVWSQVSRSFHQEIVHSALRERAFCRRFGALFPAEALTQDNWNTRLHPWLAGFSACPEDRRALPRKYYPQVPFCLLSRTMAGTRGCTFDGRGVFRFPGHRITHAAFSRDCAHMTIRTADRSKMWESRADYILSRNRLGRWEKSTRLVGESGVHCACVSPDGRYAAVSDGDQHLALWRSDAAAWHQIAKLACAGVSAGFRIRNMLFNPDSHSLLVHSTDNTLRIWNRKDKDIWKEDSVFLGKSGLQFNMSTFSPDGVWLLLHSESWRFALYNRDTRNEWTLHTLIEYSHTTVAEARFSADGQRLVLVLRDRTAALWGPGKDQWEELARLQHEEGIESALLSPDGRTLMTRCLDAGALLWTLDPQGQFWWPQAALNTEETHYRNSTTVYFDPGNRWLMAGEDIPRRIIEKGMEYWRQVRPGHWERRLNPAMGNRARVLVGPDGQQLLTLSHHYDGRPVALDELVLWGPVEGGRDWAAKARLAYPLNSVGFVVADAVFSQVAVCGLEALSLLCIREKPAWTFDPWQGARRLAPPGRH